MAADGARKGCVELKTVAEQEVEARGNGDLLEVVLASPAETWSVALVDGPRATA